MARIIQGRCNESVDEMLDSSANSGGQSRRGTEPQLSTLSGLTCQSFSSVSKMGMVTACGSQVVFRLKYARLHWLSSF